MDQLAPDVSVTYVSVRGSLEVAGPNWMDACGATLVDFLQ